VRKTGKKEGEKRERRKGKKGRRRKKGITEKKIPFIFRSGRTLQVLIDDSVSQSSEKLGGLQIESIQLKRPDFRNIYSHGPMDSAALDAHHHSKVDGGPLGSWKVGQSW
jgi:hypothetical protein